MMTRVVPVGFIRSTSKKHRIDLGLYLESQTGYGRGSFRRFSCVYNDWGSNSWSLSTTITYRSQGGPGAPLGPLRTAS